MRRARPEFAWRGAPGVFAYIFAVYQGRCFALELKRSGGRLSEAQSAAHERLRSAGAEVAICYDLDRALAQLEAWGLLRGRTQ
jgi:hypothetical protein